MLPWGKPSKIFPTTGVNATEYAAKLPDGAMSVVTLNKDTERDLNLTLKHNHVRKLQFRRANREEITV
jgi:hypothetical protein